MPNMGKPRNTALYLTSDRTGLPRIPAWWTASASLPGLFSPVEIKNHWFVDGGVVSNTPIRAALDAGADQIIVIYLDETAVLPRLRAKNLIPGAPHEFGSNFEALKDTIETMIRAQFERDLKTTRLINQWAKSDPPGARRAGYRYVELRVFQPSYPLGNTLDFGREHLDELLVRGQEEAQAWLVQEDLRDGRHPE